MACRIDGIQVQEPSSIDVKYNKISDAARTIDTAKMLGSVVAIKQEVTWKYKLITQTELSKILQIVVTKESRDKKLMHSVETFDAVTGTYKTSKMYCEATVQVTPYMRKNNEYVYKDFSITWIEE